jgi:hypothetical protein
MGTNTANLNLYKPDGTEFILRVTDLNDNWDKVDAAQGVTFCTSSTRPSTGLTNGRFIYETDTSALLTYRTSISNWAYLTTPVVANAAALTALTPVTNGMFAVQLDVNTLWQRKSGAWALATVRLDDPRAQIYQSSGQTLTNNTYQAVNFQAEDFDLPSPGGHSTSTNTSRYTCQSGFAGKYTISGALAFSAHATGIRGGKLMKNGVEVFGSGVMLPNCGGSAATRVPVPAIGVDLAVGDYVELWAYQNSGGNLSTFVLGADTCSMHVRYDGV